MRSLPQSSLIFIVSSNYHEFLPTILSRVKVIKVKNEAKYDTIGLGQINNIEGVGDALHLAQNLSKDKTSAIKWLENTIITMRSEMLDSVDDKIKSTKLQRQINSLDETYQDLKNTNVNTRLALENLFLNI